ncbi:MAG: transcriptional repressor [Bacteroidales bacterium]|nr:transcriptional repressor [Bacteroidales bacterium]
MDSIQLLSGNNIHKTPARIRILDLFLNSEIAWSEREIQQKLTGVCDRATIYRNLKLFTNVGLLHQIATEDSVTKFTIKKYPDEHLHFKCSGCGTISCLTNSKINGYELPEGFIKQDVQFLIIGICHECNNKAI